MGRHRVRYAALGPRPKTYYDDRLRPLPSRWDMYFRADYTELVGMRLRRLRQARGCSQQQTVDRVRQPRGGKYSSALLSRIEQGYANPPIYVYIHLAEVFEVAPERLLGAEDLQQPISEAEMTVIRFLRSAGIAPHDALAGLAGR